MRGHTKDPLMTREEIAAEAALAASTEKVLQKSKGAPKFGWIKGVLVRFQLHRSASTRCSNVFSSFFFFL